MKSRFNVTGLFVTNRTPKLFFKCGARNVVRPRSVMSKGITCATTSKSAGCCSDSITGSLKTNGVGTISVGRSNIISRGSGAVLNGPGPSFACNFRAHVT